MILLAINLQKYYFADWRWDGGLGNYCRTQLCRRCGRLFKGIDALPLTGQYTHYALNKKTGKPDYVTDSAASATAWSTGVKTYNGALGVDIHEKDHPTILEMAKAAGLATGNVSTAELQDATPAALVAHVTSRKCYGRVRPVKNVRVTLWKKAERIDYRTAA